MTGRNTFIVVHSLYSAAWGNLALVCCIYGALFVSKLHMSWLYTDTDGSMYIPGEYYNSHLVNTIHNSYLGNTIYNSHLVNTIYNSHLVNTIYNSHLVNTIYN